MFGQITLLSTVTDENVFTQKETYTSVRELHEELELVATIQAGYDKLRSVTYLNVVQILTSA